MMEYVGYELEAGGEDGENGVELEADTLQVFMITDFDWSGKSIEERFMAKLKTLSRAKHVDSTR